MRTAYRLYGGILDEVAAQDHDVFARRAVVPDRRRLSEVVRALATPAGRPVELARA
jgi:phytoene synthase